MQVSVETTQGLERRLTTAVPADKIESEVKSRLKSMAPKVKMAGFRPGKVPMRMVAQQHGGRVRYEVINEMITNAFYDAVTEEKLRLAGQPQFDAGNVEDGADLEFTATFEVYPEIEVAGFDGLEIERPVAEVTDADVEGMITKLREQRKTWNEVKRKAANGDQVTINFKGLLDGEVFEGGEGEAFPLELGAGRMIEGFDDAIVGAKLGDTVEFDLTFPEKYQKAELAGQNVHFIVDVTKIEEPVLPEADDAFAEGFGVKEGGIEGLRTDVRANMTRELEQGLKSTVKNAVMDALLEKNTFDIPKVMATAEAQRVADQMAEQMNSRFGQVPAGMEFKAEQFMDQGERRVALGLLLSEIIQKNELTADAERVKKEVESIASAYEDPTEVIKWYATSRERMQEVESLVLEDQVVDFILDQAKVTDKAAAFDEIVNKAQ
jgi:trigger factor